MVAARKGRTGTLEVLMKHGLQVAGMGSYGLLMAAQFGRLDFLSMLMRHIPVTQRDPRALIEAASSGHLSVVEYLLGFPEFNSVAHKDRAFFVAVSMHTLAVVETLLQHGANVHMNDDAALLVACRHGSPSLVKLLVKYSANVHAQNEEPLRLAVQRGDHRMVELLLEQGANPNGRGGDILRTAVWQSNNPKSLEALLRWGGGIHPVTFPMNALSFCIVSANRLEMASVLYSFGVRLPESDYLRLLEYSLARTDGSTDMLEFLLRVGVPITYGDDFALRSEMSRWGGRGDYLRVILGAGANIHTHHDEPLRLAVVKGNLEATSLLLEYGAEGSCVSHFAPHLIPKQSRLLILNLLEQHGCLTLEEGDRW